MITLPPPFVAARYPGYFWNTDDQKLYSLKVAGTLRPMKLYHFGWDQGSFPFVHYRVSVEGKTRSIPLYELEKLQAGVPGEIPVDYNHHNHRKLP